MPGAVVGRLSRSPRSGAPRRRRSALAVWVLVGVLSGGTGVLAGWQLLAPHGETGTEPSGDELTYRVRAGSVGRSASYRVETSWDEVPLGVGASEGVITSHEVAFGDRVESGTVLLTVDLRPVVVAAGRVPAFRALEEGDEGEDVRQLQEHLRDQGYLRSRADGVFGPASGRAVRAWQRDLGLEPDGVVRAGDVVFSPALPAWVELAEEVAVGARVVPGTALGVARAGAPRFELVVDDDRRRPPAASLPATVELGDLRWPATTGTPVLTADGAVTVPLVGDGGGAVCADECGAVPMTGAGAVLTAEVSVVPEVAGPVVPVSALRSTADGTTSVVRVDGDLEVEVAVQVVGGDGGRAVVSGLVEGDVVRLFATDAAA